MKIHNDVRSLGQILKFLQRDIPIPQSLTHLPVYTKSKLPTATTVKKTLRKLQHRLNRKAEKRATIRTRFLNSALKRFSDFNGTEGFHTMTQNGLNAVDMGPIRTKDMVSARIQEQYFTVSTPTPPFYTNRTTHNWKHMEAWFQDIYHYIRTRHEPRI